MDELASLNQALGARDRLITSLNQVVSERDEQIASLDQTLIQLRESPSWRLTNPVIFVGRQLLRIKMGIRGLR